MYDYDAFKLGMIKMAPRLKMILITARPSKTTALMAIELSTNRCVCLEDVTCALYNTSLAFNTHERVF